MPYKRWTPNDVPPDASEVSSDEAAPPWLQALPVAGHKFECACGCKLDIPTRQETP